MDTQEALDRAIAAWLARAHPAPEQARSEWAIQGVALLPLGDRFAAVRMPADVIHAALASRDPDQVAVSLGEVLGGSIIYDHRVAGGTYYALVQGHAGLVWAYDDIATCLGHGTYLGVPRLDRQQPPGAYWMIPPRYEGDLCAPRTIIPLIELGRSRLASAPQPDPHGRRVSADAALGSERPPITEASASPPHKLPPIKGGGGQSWPRQPSRKVQ